MIDVSDESIATLKERLLDQSLPMPKRYRALFSLRNCRGDGPRDALVTALSDPSTLLAHDVAFALGQMQDAAAMASLQRTVEDVNVHPMVRHEAAEALGAIGKPECLSVLRAFTSDGSREVAETCQLALKRIEWKNFENILHSEGKGVAEKGGVGGGGGDEDGSSPYLSVDPTPAASDALSTVELIGILLDSSIDMFDRYRALFRLRNRGTPDAIEGIASVLKADDSALLKHEVAYVLGQIQSDVAVESLMEALADERQHAMVRHEAAEALGAIASPKCVTLLEKFASHSEPVVAQSCEVALDVLRFESQEGSFQYADVSVHG